MHPGTAAGAAGSVGSIPVPPSLANNPRWQKLTPEQQVLYLQKLWHQLQQRLLQQRQQQQQQAQQQQQQGGSRRERGDAYLPTTAPHCFSGRQCYSEWRRGERRQFLNLRTMVGECPWWGRYCRDENGERATASGPHVACGGAIRQLEGGG
ncbi:hypothetical protein CLOM_g22049 [Closterium sp. NIES-68]|nr:hypothetical protein CLOM_g22049 [Closterium sp. NIES-68]GJP77763.1 hypothetical protein CLOP_g8114 [Closterium sp. NIES-67]